MANIMAFVNTYWAVNLDGDFLDEDLERPHRTEQAVTGLLKAQSVYLAMLLREVRPPLSSTLSAVASRRSG